VLGLIGFVKIWLF